MYKLWAKEIKKNHIINSIVIKNKENIDSSKKMDKCLKEICKELDISVPVWLKKHGMEFSQFKYVTFYPQDFIDEVDFDKLEVELIDSDKKPAD
jgi:tRNA G26 N,N-dimethylase Trm1